MLSDLTKSCVFDFKFYISRYIDFSNLDLVALALRVPYSTFDESARHFIYVFR